MIPDKIKCEISWIDAITQEKLTQTIEIDTDKVFFGNQLPDELRSQIDEERLGCEISDCVFAIHPESGHLIAFTNVKIVNSDCASDTCIDEKVGELTDLNLQFVCSDLISAVSTPVRNMLTNWINGIIDSDKNDAKGDTHDNM